MTREIEQEVLRILNEVALETINEGKNGPWLFTRTVHQEGNTFTLSFINAVGEREVTFNFDGNLIEENYISEAFFNVIFDNIIDWGIENGENWEN
ncbi:MAG: hypothetical protein MUC49_07970 [Raineya sp.]|jgi:hypothetical protein|nr:hypothetical protein [Raineya sp.]